MKTKKYQDPWYLKKNGFFGPGYLKEYKEYLSQERTLKEVDFLEKVLSINRSAKIFDCPCGFGRHSIILAKKGYQVTGQDINSMFLNKGKKNAQRLNLSIRWIKGDMRNIKFSEEFDAALCLFSSLGYLENDEEHQRTLGQIAKTLKTGGKLVLDVINRDRFIREYQKQVWKQLPDGSIILSENNFDHKTGYNYEKRIRFWKKGRREEVFHFIRMYTIPELLAMLKTVGLEAKGLYGNFDFSPITFQSKRYILIAIKN